MGPKGYSNIEPIKPEYVVRGDKGAPIGASNSKSYSSGGAMGGANLNMRLLTK
jgi:hypothetical protein